jgi:hypothetical protein
MLERVFVSVSLHLLSAHFRTVIISVVVWLVNRGQLRIKLLSGLLGALKYLETIGEQRSALLGLQCGQ